MNHVFHRHTLADLPLAASGDGPYIIDTSGKRYIDACGGAAVSCLGHSNARVQQSIHRQIDKIPYAHSSFFSNDALEQLADMLVARAPQDLDRVYFVSGGSEAMEAALKMARQYFLERDQPEKQLFISRKQSYHGNTLGVLSVGGNQWRREPFRPLLMQANHISACYAYRDQSEDETEIDYGLRVANELETRILELGPEKVIGFIAEPVVGATLGAVASVEGYFKRVREICDQYGILLILDEVMCGMGRTGTLFACEQDGITGDLVAIAKGLAAGYQPIGALLANKKIFETIRDGSGFFQHGHTFMGHPTACAAAVATLTEFEEHDLLNNVNLRGEQLRHRLRESLSECENVGDVRGRGLFIGIELVKNSISKQPFDPAIPLHTIVKKKAMSNGLMCYPMAGTIDGQQGHHVLLAPAYIINDSHVDEIVEKMSTSITQSLRSI